jgi:DNA-binding transcriptional LysR family regulator
LYDRILQLYQSVGCQPEIVQEASTSPARIGLVAAGLGIAFVPKIFCNLSYEGIVYKELHEKSPELVYAVAWRPNRQSAVLQAFLEIIKTQDRSNENT